MKKIIAVITVVICILSCNNNDDVKTGRFTLTGNIKNVPDQKIYLEQLYFSQKNPEIVDTAQIKNGKFSMSAASTEEGLYRIRLEKMEAGFIFINDASNINFTADINDVSLTGPTFDTKANSLLKNLIITLDKKSRALNESDVQLDSVAKNNDSSMAVLTAKREELAMDYKKFILNYIDSVSDPVVTMFALGYTKGIEPEALEKVVPSLSKRFPKHLGVATMVSQFNQYIAKLKEPKPATKSTPAVGDMAPDFTLNDTNGKPFSLSELKGKYVLVDFWASWCGPCRRENPNVVAAFEKFKDKNFTILGVSLDEEKDSWLKAISQDHLEWKQVSDLKYWSSIVVPLYGLEGIPFNVLVDPQGKIIGKDLREEALHAKLDEVLNGKSEDVKK